MNKTILAGMLALAVALAYPVAASVADDFGTWDQSAGSEWTQEHGGVWDQSEESGWSQDYGAGWEQGNDLSGSDLTRDSGIVESNLDQSDKALVGAAVKNPEGEFLGVIDDFVKDSDGRTSFAILSFGKDEDFGDGGRFVAIPFDSLTCHGQECTLDSTYDQLASSPVFLSKDDLTNRQTAANIYRYFGQQPFWTDESAVGHDSIDQDINNEDSVAPDTGAPFRMDEESPRMDMGQIE